MKVLKLAVEKKRWDLAAHTIVLATASVLKNEGRPRSSPRVSGNPSLRKSGVRRVPKTRRKRV